MIERKFVLNLDKKNLDENGTFYGYASIFDIVDAQGDIISRGAFDLKGSIPLLWQHKQDQPIGKVLEMRETERGLFLKSCIVIDIKQGYEAYKLLQSGVLNGLSIGYLIKKHKIDRKTGVRVITSVKLVEISLVTFPANEYARVSSVKSTCDSDQNFRERVAQLIEALRKQPT